MRIGRIKVRLATLVWVAALVFTCGCCWSAASDAIGQIVNDVIIGHNNKGPYTLSWTEIDTKSVVAVINGRTLKSSDFSIDNSTGMLSFTSVLLQDAIVRITYRTTTKSKAVAGATSVPVTLKVFSGKDADLQLTGLHVQTDRNNPNAAKTIVGLSGEKKWTAGKVHSQFLISQINEADGGQGSAMDRAVIKVGGEGQSGAFRFSGSLLNVGSEFKGEKEYGVALGKQESGFAVRFVPGKRVEASASIKTAQDTAGAKSGTESVVQEQSVVVSPTDTTKVSLVHQTTASQTAASGSDSNTETSTVNLNQQIGSTTSAAVSFQSTSVNAGGSTVDTTTQQLSVTSKPTDKVGVTAQVQQTDSDATGSQMATSTTVQVKPGKNVSVAASHATVDSNRTGLSTDTRVSFNAAAAANTTLKGSVVQKNTSGQGAYQRDFSLTSRPLSYAKLSAVFSQSGSQTAENMTRGAVLELLPLTHTKLGAGYKYVQTGLRVMTIADYSASSKPLRFLEFSGSYRDRDVEQDYAPDTSLFKVSFSPSKVVSLSGTYQSNPETDAGVVQNYETTTAALKVRFGTVDLTAGLSQKDQYTLSQRFEEQSVGLAVPLFGHGKLTTAYRIARVFGEVGSGTDTYSMGYRHDVGSVFNLSFTGNYYRSRNGSSDPEQETYDAQAAVGIKF